MVVTKVKSKTKLKKHSNKFAKNGKKKSIKRNMSKRGKSMRGGSGIWSLLGVPKTTKPHRSSSPLSTIQSQTVSARNKLSAQAFAASGKRNPAGEAFLPRYKTSGKRFY
jgi:hypothetical protein